MFSCILLFQIFFPPEIELNMNTNEMPDKSNKAKGTSKKYHTWIHSNFFHISLAIFPNIKNFLLWTFLMKKLLNYFNNDVMFVISLTKLFFLKLYEIQLEKWIKLFCNKVLFCALCSFECRDGFSMKYRLRF